MEKFPSHNSEEVIADTTADVEKSAEKRSSFLWSLKQGQLNSEKVLGIDPLENTNPEQQLFFSHINPDNPVPIAPFTPSRRPFVTEYGLCANNNLYSFTDSYREQLLTHEVLRHGKDANNVDEFFDALDKTYSGWTETYAKISEKQFLDQARQPFLDKIESFKESVNSRYLQNGLKKYILMEFADKFPGREEREYEKIYAIGVRLLGDLRADSKTTYEELYYRGYNKEEKQRINAASEARIAKAYEKFREKAAELKVDYEPLDVWHDARKKFDTDFKEFVINNGYMTKEEFKEYSSFQKLVNLTTPGNTHTDSIYSKLKSVIQHRAGEDFQEKNQNDFDLLPLMQAFSSPYYSSLRDRKQQAPTEEELIDQLKLEFKAKPELDRNSNAHIKKFVALCEHQFYDLVPKYYRAKVRWGKTPVFSQEKIHYERKKIIKEMHAAAQQNSIKLANEHLPNLGKNIVEIAFGEQNVRKAVFTPAGCFVSHDNGSLSMHAISPFDERILATMSEPDANAWATAWDENMRTQIKESSPGLANFINRQAASEMAENQEHLPEYYQKLNELKKQYDFDTPGLFSNEGYINRLPTEQEIDSLGGVIAPISNFVNVVDFESNYEENVTATIVGSLKSFIRRGVHSGANPLFNISQDRRSGELNFNVYQKLLHSLNNDRDKANDVFYSFVGTQLFRTVPSGKIREFSELLGPRANISKQEIYRHYRETINSFTERHSIAVRSNFIREFKKYIQGQPTAEFEPFFDSFLKNAPAASAAEDQE